MAIWQITPSLEVLNGMNDGTIVQTLGIEFTEIGEDFLIGRMPVDGRTRQPYGILHGGASIVLAESLGSIASTLCIDVSKKSAVGVSVNGSHIRSIREGYVYGKCSPSHIGRKTHVWDIEIMDEHQKLICKSRLTVMIIDRQKP